MSIAEEIIDRMLDRHPLEHIVRYLGNRFDWSPEQIQGYSDDHLKAAIVHQQNNGIPKPAYYRSLQAEYQRRSQEVFK